MLKFKSLIVAALVALPMAALAQPATHDWEVILGGSGTANTEFRRQGASPGGQFGATLSLGYFLTDNWEVAGRQTFNYATSGQWNGATQVAVDYNFHLDKLVPFIGANLGYLYSKNTTGLNDDNWSAGPEGGLKFYLQDKAFLFAMGTYNVPFRGKSSWDDGQWILTVGIGLNL